MNSNTDQTNIIESIITESEPIIQAKNYSQSDVGDNPTVNLATGRLRYAFADLSVGHGNFAINLSHVYLSNVYSKFKNKFSEYGSNWKLNLSQCVIYEGSTYYYLDEAGETHRFAIFDTNRYYDTQNAKVVLTKNTSDNGCVITDGVGNKLYFNANGLLTESVSCHNSLMRKIYEYDESKRLKCVYDKRSIPSGGSVAKNRIDLEYGAGGRLCSMTSYCNYNTKLLQLKYTYDTDGNLTDVQKITFESDTSTTKQIWEFTYSDGYLHEVVDSEAASVMQFKFLDDRLIKQSIGKHVMKNKVLKGSGPRPNVRIVRVKVFQPIKYITYEYDFSRSDGISVETKVTNENGITLAYFIDRDARITSSFEKVSDNLLKTLSKQGEKNITTPIGSLVHINNNGTIINYNGVTQLNFVNFNMARNDAEEQCKHFDFAVWLKTHNVYDVLEAKFTYIFKNNRTVTSKVLVNPRACYAWQRVSSTVTIPDKLTTKDLTAIAVTMLVNKSTVDCTDSFEINTIGFAPASKTEMYLSGNVLLSQSDSVLWDRLQYNTLITESKSFSKSFYFTENDVVATFTNKYAHSTYPQGKCIYDVICNNGTNRIANIHVIQFCYGDKKSSTSDTPFYTNALTPDGGTEITTKYNYSSVIMEIETIGKRDGKESSTSAKYDYKGKTLSETDEYGVSKVYTYNSYGNLTDIQVKGSDNVVGSRVHYDYDSEGRLLHSHDGIAGQQIGYDYYDQAVSVTEGKVNDDNLQLLSHHVDSDYDSFYDKVMQVTEYNGATQYGNHTVTYENGRVRTVTDGKAKYGVKYDDLNKKVEYTQFDSGVEKTLQTDTIAIDPQTHEQTHTSKFIGGDEVTTKVDKYGKVLSVSKSNQDSTVYAYDDPDGKHVESEFARKPTKRTTSANTTEYRYDYDGNLTGFTEKENEVQTLEVKQITPDATKYVYSDSSQYFVTVERDQDKILNPRVTAVKYRNNTEENFNKPNTGTFQFEINYEYKPGAIGLIDKKKTTGPGAKLSTTEYAYETVLNNTRLKQSKYSGICWPGGGAKCRSKYTADYTYDSHGEITRIVDNIQWTKEPSTTPTIVQNDRAYHYTDLHQLDWEMQGGSKIDYEYYPNGRLYKVNGVERTYDDQGRLSSIGNRTFGYDSYGNRITDTNYTTKVYHYDHNLLTKAYDQGINVATYKYNTDGVRCEKVHNGITTKYLLDGNKLLGETQSGHTPGVGVINGKKHIKYIYDNEGIQFVKIGDLNYELVKDVFNNVVMVIGLDDGKIECIYCYDAFGKCKVLDENGNVDNDSDSIGNTNPIRWKSFYYDTGTGFYYANGSYYDPTTGTYLDAAPVSAMIDNALNVRTLDRNTPMCDNILELAGNPFTVFTPSGLSPDPTSAAYKLSWWQKAILSVTRWWKDIPNWQKVACAAIFITLSVIIAVGTAGASTGAQAGLLSGAYATSQLALAAKVALVELSIGVGLAVAGWALSSALTGSWDTDALQDEVADAMFFTGMFMFISASVNYVKYISRSTPVSTSELRCATQCFIAGTLVHCEDGLKKIEDVQVGDKVLAYNEETGEQAYKTVLHIFRNESKDWTGVTVNDKEIVSTPGHKYYLPLTKQWVSAKDLKVGDTVLLSNGQLAKVQKTRSIHYDTPQTTYNFEVEDFHTYYVETGVLVHNRSCTELNMTRQGAIKYGKNYLGEGYTRIEPGYYRSADGLRTMHFDFTHHPYKQFYSSPVHINLYGWRNAVLPGVRNKLISNIHIFFL